MELLSMWITSYLTSSTSLLSLVARGAGVQVSLQGLVLVRTEFYMYTKTLGDPIRHYRLDYHMYADDTQVYMSFKSMDVELQDDA